MERSITGETAEIFRNIAFAMTEHGFDCLVVSLFIVSNKIPPIPILLVGNDFWKFVDFEFLILWRVLIVKSPLLERNVSTDKVKKLTNNFILVLNDVK